MKRTLIGSLLLVAAVAAACGDDDDADETSDTGAAATTAAEASATTVGDTATTGAGDATATSAVATTEEATVDTTAPAPPAEMQTVQVMTFPAQAYRAPILVAQEQGFLAQRGIELEFVDQPANVSGMQGLVATDSDIGYFSVPTLTQAVQAGTDAVFFCGNILPLESSVMAAPDSDLPSVDDGATPEELFAALAATEDLKIGVQTPIGSGLQLFTQAAFEELGVTNATYITTGTQVPITVAALQNGDVDVAIATPTPTQQIMSAGDAKRLIYMPDHVDLFKLYGSGMGALRSWVDENPELASGYCDAIAEAVEFINDPANADVVDPILSADTGITPEVAALVREESFPEYDTVIPKDVFDATVAKYTELAVVAAEPVVNYDAVVVTPGG